MIRKLVNILIILTVVAVLYKLFGGDLGLAFTTVFNKVVEIVDSISDWILELGFLQKFLD